MRSRATALLALLLCLAPCVEAQADTALEGRGFRVAVPPAFRPLPETARGALAALDVPLTEGLELRGAPRLDVFYTGRAAEPASLLLVGRFDLTERGTLATVRHLQRYVLANLRRSPKHFARLLADGAVHLTPGSRDGRETLEMRHEGAYGPLGMEEPRTRALVVAGDDHMLLFCVLVCGEPKLDVDAAWQSLTASLAFPPPGREMRRALLYGGIGLGALLLLLLVRRRRRRRRQAPQRAHRASVADAWKTAVAVPERHPAGGPPGRVAEGEGRAQADVPGSAPREDPPLAAALPFPTAPAAPTDGHGEEPEADLLRAARSLVARPPPERKGLKRTRRAPGP